MVVEARKLSETLSQSKHQCKEDAQQIVRALDAMGYDEAAQYVYGMDYPQWKKLHSNKATDEQMEKFNESKSLWATHDKDLLAKRTASSDATTATKEAAETKTISITNNELPSSLLSNVCCQPMDDEVPDITPPPKQSRLPVRQQLALPDSLSFTLGILTVSDRAFAGKYQDLSGPAVQQAVQKALASNNITKLLSSTIAVVPDNVDVIQKQLKEWASCHVDNPKMDLILTTGGTGFAPRDVTPEATQAILDYNCSGLINYCTMECAAKMQPLASLSRGMAGVRGSTLIVNLPGNPEGVQEIIPILLPLALHAVADIKAC
jgi:gephyrin